MIESELRMRGSPLKKQPHAEAEDTEVGTIDFRNVVLYIGVLQTVLATMAVSCVSILACSVLPERWSSAVRTLTISSACACLIMRKPFRLGRVRGLQLIFGALRPGVGIYIASLVLEQLVHTCTREAASPSWRRVVFHICIVVAMASGFARARSPLEQTDLPFLVTAIAMLVVALLPPPAVILSGPLCSEPSLASSSERLARAFVFSLLYTVFVYSSAAPMYSSGELLICVMRASAASIWVLGCHMWLLPVAFAQIACVVHTRLTDVKAPEAYHLADPLPSDEIASTSLLESDIEGDMEGGLDKSEILKLVRAHDDAATSTTSPVASFPRVEASPVPAFPRVEAIGAPCDLIKPLFASIGPRELVNISDVGGAGDVMFAAGSITKARMVEIAETIERKESELAK